MKRATALDMLRGISIFGMILSANIPFGVLPAWMYHAQTPPPSHIYNPLIPGISWVDLVLPIFIFCMGAAIPLALNKKIESGEKPIKTGFSILERYFMLVFFSIFIAHILPWTIGNGRINFTIGSQNINGYDLNIISIIGFILLFPLYMHIKDVRRRRVARIVGWTGTLGLLFFIHTFYGLKFSLHRSNIIILLLANAYLFGTISWYITRKSVTNRLMLLGVWAAIQLTCKYTYFDEALNSNQILSWIFIFRMTHYLLLLIPATLVGDILYKRLQQKEFEIKVFGNRDIHIFGLLAMFGIWLLVGLYNRWLIALFVSSILILPITYIYIKKHLPSYLIIFKIAAFLIILGLILEPVEGGIKKDPVTASYLFITGGISICWLSFLECICRRNEGDCFVKLFSGAGSNPLLGYVTTSWFILPAMKITLAIIPYDWLYPEGYPWIGVLRAILLIWGVMSLVALASRKRIYWRA